MYKLHNTTHWLSTRIVYKVPHRGGWFKICNPWYARWSLNRTLEGTLPLVSVLAQGHVGKTQVFTTELGESAKHQPCQGLSAATVQGFVFRLGCLMLIQDIWVTNHTHSHGGMMHERRLDLNMFDIPSSGATTTQQAFLTAVSRALRLLVTRLLFHFHSHSPRLTAQNRITAD